MIDRRPEGRAVLCGSVVESSALLLPWSDPAAQWGLGVFATVAVSDASPTRGIRSETEIPVSLNDSSPGR